jgi:hypothetical protein
MVDRMGLRVGLGMMMVVLGGWGCNPFHPQPSDKVKTADLYCTFGVSEVGGNIMAIAGFQQKNAWGTYVVLSATDQIRVNGVELEYGDLIVMKGYSKQIARADRYVFELIREGEAVYSSTVTVPSAVTIQTPASGAVCSRAKGMDLTWVNNGTLGTTISFRITGEDIDSSSVVPTSVADIGVYSIPANFIQPIAGKENATFSAKVEMTRRVSGQMDLSLKGTIEGTAGTSVIVTSTP